jgi:hypothetical protein
MKHFILIFILLMACQSDEASLQASLVVEAYIFENKPINNIILSEVNPINSASDLVAVSNASVFIMWKENSYKLDETNILGTYAYTEDKLKVVSGDSYELRIDYNGETYFAETIVPISPKQLTSNKDTLNIKTSTDLIKITWENPDSLWYLGVIANANPTSTDFPFNNFFSIPTKSDNQEIKPNNVEDIGNKQFILYGITDDYENLYRISTSAIGSTNAGNLSRGFGIFAGFSSDTLDIVVIDK